MRRIVEDLDGNRRALFEEAQAKIDPPRNPDPNAERPDLAYWRNLARYQPAVTDYLKAQVLTAEERHAEALAVLEQLAQAHLPRSDLFPETAGLYMRLGRWREAEQVFENVLANDPDNVQAHIGMSRMALRQRKFRVAAQSALNALERNHHHPLAHFLLGRALVGMKEYQRAAEAFRGAISLNPNFPAAHIRLAALLETKLGDTRSARAHRDLAWQMRRSTRLVQPAAERAGTAAALSTAGDQVPVPKIAEMPPLEESLIVVTGLPRSGTSMVMQMLAAGNMAIVSDGLRQPDEDNPRGYFEFEPVKQLLQDARWLLEARGKAIKIVAPLITALPPALPCRVVLCERDVDELLDSQERMRARRNQPGATMPERRLLKDEYVRILGRLEAMFTRRPQTQLLVIHHRRAIADPLLAARRLNQFLGGSLDEAKMAAAVDPALYRNRGVS